MENQTDSSHNSEQKPITLSPWKMVGWICGGVVVLSVLSCVVIAVMRSNGLTRVTVTALDPDAEPRDHELPFFKKKEALPDYEVIVILKGDEWVNLGAKPDRSAADGLIWELNEPISTSDIASVRLRDQDKVISDTIAEVQLLGDSTTDENYQFDFESQRSFSVGLRSFFRTPIGVAISGGVLIAVVLIVVSRFDLPDLF